MIILAQVMSIWQGRKSVRLGVSLFSLHQYPYIENVRTEDHCNQQHNVDTYLYSTRALQSGGVSLPTVVLENWAIDAVLLTLDCCVCNKNNITPCCRLVDAHCVLTRHRARAVDWYLRSCRYAEHPHAVAIRVLLIRVSEHGRNSITLATLPLRKYQDYLHNWGLLREAQGIDAVASGVPLRSPLAARCRQ